MSAAWQDDALRALDAATSDFVAHGRHMRAPGRERRPSDFVPVTDKHAVRLGEVQQTPFVPLYGRATQAHAKRSPLHDPKAVEMVNAADCAFTRFTGGPSPLRAAPRTRIVDVWVRVRANPGPHFLAAEPVLADLTEPEVKNALGLIARHLPGSHVTLDTAAQLPAPLRGTVPVTTRCVLTAAHLLARNRFARYRLNSSRSPARHPDPA